MNSKWQRAGQQVKPGLKIVGKLPPWGRRKRINVVLLIPGR